MRWVSDQYTLASLQVLQVSQFLPFLMRLQLPGLSSLARRQDMDEGQGWAGEEKILKDLWNRFQKNLYERF